MNKARLHSLIGDRCSKAAVAALFKMADRDEREGSEGNIFVAYFWVLLVLFSLLLPLKSFSYFIEENEKISSRKDREGRETSRSRGMLLYG